MSEHDNKPPSDTDKVIDQSNALSVQDVRLREPSDGPEATQFFEESELAHKVDFGHRPDTEHHSIDKVSAKEDYIRTQQSIENNDKTVDRER